MRAFKKRLKSVKNEKQVIIPPKKVFEDCTNIVMCVVFMALRDLHGFGFERMKKLKMRMNDLMLGLANGKGTIKDLETALVEEGIDIKELLKI